MNTPQTSFFPSIFSIKKHRTISLYQHIPNDNTDFFKHSFHFQKKRRTSQEVKSTSIKKRKANEIKVNAKTIKEGCIDFICVNRNNNVMIVGIYEKKEIMVINGEEPFDMIGRIRVKERIMEMFGMMKYIGGVLCIGCFGNVELLKVNGNDIVKIKERCVDGIVCGAIEINEREMVIMTKDKMIEVVNFWTFETIKKLDCFRKDIPFWPLINTISLNNLILVNNATFYILRTQEKEYSPIYKASFHLKTFLSRQLSLNDNILIYYSTKQICIFNTQKFDIDIMIPSFIENKDLLQEIAKLTINSIFIITYNGNLCIFEVASKSIITSFENCYGQELSILKTPNMDKRLMILNKKRNRIYIMEDYKFKSYKIEPIKDNDMFMCLTNETFVYVDIQNELRVFELNN